VPLSVLSPSDVAPYWFGAPASPLVRRSDLDPAVFRRAAPLHRKREGSSALRLRSSPERPVLAVHRAQGPCFVPSPSTRTARRRSRLDQRPPPIPWAAALVGSRPLQRHQRSESSSRRHASRCGLHAGRRLASASTLPPSGFLTLLAAFSSLRLAGLFRPAGTRGVWLPRVLTAAVDPAQCKHRAGFQYLAPGEPDPRHYRDPDRTSSVSGRRFRPRAVRNRLQGRPPTDLPLAVADQLHHPYTLPSNSNGARSHRARAASPCCPLMAKPPPSNWPVRQTSRSVSLGNAAG
jgi:hypothetical protein